MNTDGTTVEHSRGVVFGPNFGSVAGGNIYQGDYNISQEALFEEPTLKEVEPSTWSSPPQACELVTRLTHSRFLVLAGNRLDEPMIARHVAWLLREQLRQKDQAVCVREWLQSTGVQRLESIFHETDVTILLLPEVSPHHFGHRLDRLIQLSRTRDAYVILTTEASQTDWCLVPGAPETRSWVELSWESFYGVPFLYEFLEKELSRLIHALPEGLLPKGVAPEAPLVPGLSLTEVVTRLQKPDAIRRFLMVLSTLSSPVSAKEVCSRLAQASNEREAVNRWYSLLERREQALALGLALFDGLPDDQVFAGLDLLVSSAWRAADPLLAKFDYYDLRRVGTFFRLVDSGSGNGWIEVPSERERDEILRAAWEVQRRRLLATLPVVTELIKGLAADGPAVGRGRASGNSADAARAQNSAKAQNPEPTSSQGGEPSLGWRADQALGRALFGTQRRRSQLQQAVIGFLSRIALLSTDAVESCFNELAVDGSAAERNVIAQAFADWHKAGSSESLFKMLHRWWREGCRLTYFGDPSDEKVRERKKRLAATRATVALTVGYASLYDPPNLCHRSLLELLPALLQDQDPMVRSSVLEVTLPLVVSQHLRQLQAFLRTRAMADEGLIHATGFGIALAFEQRPAEAVQVIDTWRTAGAAALPDRERLLAVVAYACGYLRIQPDQALMSSEQVFEILRSILSTEAYPLVRRSVLIAVGLQAVHNFDVAASIIQPLIAEVTLEDRSLIVGVLVRAYLHQRGELKGGDETVEIDGHCCDVWRAHQRPLTPIEAYLYSWIENGVFPVAQQVAVQAFAAFATTDLECQERELAARHLGVPGMDAAVPVSYALAPRLRPLDPLGSMSVFLALPPADAEARSILSPLLAEVIEVRSCRLPVRPYRQLVDLIVERRTESLQAREDRVRTLPHVPMLIERWLGAPLDPVQRMASRLRSAVNIYRWRWVIVALASYASAMVLRWLIRAL